MLSILHRPDGILACFGALLLALGGFTWFDAGRRAELETAVLASALGDDHHFPAPAEVVSGSVVARSGNASLVVADPPVREFPETQLRPEGTADSGAVPFVLYRDAKAEPGSPAGDARYLKLGVGRFLSVTERAASVPER
jgi:hypothetical protein